MLYDIFCTANGMKNVPYQKSKSYQTTQPMHFERPLFPRNSIKNVDENIHSLFILNNG